MLQKIENMWSKFQKAEAEDTVPSIQINRGWRKLGCAIGDFHDYPFKHGDDLTLNARGFPHCQTPDGSMHILAAPSYPIRIPPRMEFGTFKGYRLPLHLVLLTGAGIETLEAIGRAHIDNYIKFMGLAGGMRVLEIGCGIGRDVFQFIERHVGLAQYIGVDVTLDSIVWCRRNITPKFPHFRFYHFDAKHELYNPLGSKSSLDFRLPAANGSIDRIFLGSVFTHIFEDEVTHYMREMRRVLRPGGLAYATFFLYSKETIEAARRTLRSPNGLTFQHPHGDGCYISDAAYPTGSVAYTDEAMSRMMASAGLKLARPYLKGWWSGFYEQADDGQEVAVLTPT
jgi:SAM-dependent methyltransferase